ncbi:hypothetical protein F7725_012340 [Dissostichus mawsoni]|uniref:Uncharacterized protein n=1 Tax=Dissostichus mawsoni TaxID=36200 RepID=A0A7J5YQK8_DISMA|nr:hypothetical protein F7725_012340 [Dissostichus mawsoni]
MIGSFWRLKGFINTQRFWKQSRKPADLQVVLSVQPPGAEVLLRGARDASQTLGVKGQAHDGLRVGFSLVQLGPLGNVPQQQGTILVSGQQERSGARVWLEVRRTIREEFGQMLEKSGGR